MRRRGRDRRSGRRVQRGRGAVSPGGESRSSGEESGRG